MLKELQRREAEGTPIKVGLIGAGAMGAGIAWQVNRTPGMEIVFIGDIDLGAAHTGAEISGHNALQIEDPNAEPEPIGDNEIFITDDPLALLRGDNKLAIDVLVESSNTVGPAARYCFAAIERGIHVVLMNAEVDLALGPLLHRSAERHGVIVTSDAGDQHGVLKRMIDEISIWGFDIVQAGNIKGYLDRHATSAILGEEAAKRNLSLIQCCAYTDGTKLAIEMACLGNSAGLIPSVRGMEGPRAENVQDAMQKFDFAAYGQHGRLDYLLGAEPGGGVYVIGHSDELVQAEYMRYYKMGDGPYYLFYRPYHLCHVETPSAIASVVLRGEAIMTPDCGRLSDVYAHAKRDLAAGTVIDHGIGGDEFYGLIETCEVAEREGLVPIALLEADGYLKSCMVGPLAKDAPLTSDLIQLPDSYLREKFAEQEEFLRRRSG